MNQGYNQGGYQQQYGGPPGGQGGYPQGGGYQQGGYQQGGYPQGGYYQQQQPMYAQQQPQKQGGGGCGCYGGCNRSYWESIMTYQPPEQPSHKAAHTAQQGYTNKDFKTHKYSHEPTPYDKSGNNPMNASQKMEQLGKGALQNDQAKGYAKKGLKYGLDKLFRAMCN